MSQRIGYLAPFFVAAVICTLCTTSRGSALEIVHVNDHHSHLDSELVEFVVDGRKARIRIGGLPAMASLFNSFSSNVLKVHAGDALTGTLFYTILKGDADATLMKTICFDVFVLGNHEFDDGDETLQVCVYS